MQKEDAALAFLRRAAYVYRPPEGAGEIVLEFSFTDLGRRYQMVLGRKDCAVLTEGFKPFDARAEAAYPMFEDLIRGKRSPAMALLKGQVKASGDLRLLKRLEEFFPGLEMGQ